MDACALCDCPTYAGRCHHCKPSMPTLCPMNSVAREAWSVEQEALDDAANALQRVAIHYLSLAAAGLIAGLSVLVGLPAYSLLGLVLILGALGPLAYGLMRLYAYSRVEEQALAHLGRGWGLSRNVSPCTTEALNDPP